MFRRLKSDQIWRLDRKFYLKYPFENIKEENLPPISNHSYRKKIIKNEKFHIGRVWERMNTRDSNQTETKIFATGANFYGQCGIVAKTREVTQLPIDNLLSSSVQKNQEKLLQTDQKWNMQFKSVSAVDPPKIIDNFQNPFSINIYNQTKIKFHKISAGRHTSLAMGKQRKRSGQYGWVVLGSGINDYGQLGRHVAPSKPIDSSGNIIDQQFDDKGKRVWNRTTSDSETDEEIQFESLLAAFRRIPFYRECGIPHYYKPLSISTGGSHSAVVFGHSDYDPTATPAENIMRSKQYPNFVVTMGNNANGQCGVSGSSDDYNIVDDQEYVDRNQNFSWNPYDVICGESHTFFISRRIGMNPSRGWRVFSSGLNDDGQLGLGHFNQMFNPTEIQNLPPLSSLSTKGDFSLGLDIHNQIYGWGTNAHGIFGSFTEELAINRPYKLTQKIFEKILDSKPVQVAAGSRAGIILTDKRSVYTFGTGLLGYSGDANDITCPFPVKVGENFFGGGKPTAVFPGYDTFGVITDIGELYTWGRSSFNGIGLFEEESAIQVQPFPWRATKGINQKNVLDLDFGLDHLVTLCAV